MVKTNDVLNEFEETAMLGAKKVREFLSYQGSNKDYLHKAKAGSMAMGAYSRLRATLANETALRLQGAKIDGSGWTRVAELSTGDQKQ